MISCCTIQNTIYRCVLLATLFLIVDGQVLVHAERTPENFSKSKIFNAVQQALSEILSEHESRVNEYFRRLGKVQDLIEKIMVKTEIVDADITRIRRAKACPNPWKLFANSCYQFVEPRMTWDEAKNVCLVENSILVEINTEQENSFLTSRFDAFWTGGNDQTEEGTFTWSSNNHTYTYTNWESTQPRSGSYKFGREENCMLVSKTEWHDYPCSDKFRFICEMTI